MINAMPAGPTWNAYSLTDLSQVSTAAYVDVAGSKIDLAQCRNGNGGYSMVVSGNSVNVRLLGSNDGVVFIQVGAPITIAAGGQNSLMFGPSQTSWYRYYVLQIIDTVGGTHGTVAVTGFAI